MSMERDLGTLIRKCSPYGGGGPKTMHFGNGDPPSREELMTVVGARDDSGGNLARFHPEIQGYPGEWSFMGLPFRVTKALMIPYRYPLREKDGIPTGVFATQRLLVGYTGGNGP